MFQNVGGLYIWQKRSASNYYGWLLRFPSLSSWPIGWHELREKKLSIIALCCPWPGIPCNQEQIQALWHSLLVDDDHTTRITPPYLTSSGQTAFSFRGVPPNANVEWSLFFWILWTGYTIGDNALQGWGELTPSLIPKGKS